MKKIATIVLTLVMCVGLLTGCGQDYSAEESTVFVLKNGKVVSTDVEEFGADYDEAALKEFVENEIKEYTQSNGDKSVSLEKFEVKDGKASLTIEYSSVADYARFNGVELFNGTVAEAMAAGYSFDGEFASIDGDEVKACDSSSILGEDGLKVAVIKGNVNVNVPGTVVYVSADNTRLVDKNTIGIAEGINIITGTDTITSETTEQPTEAGTEAVDQATEAETQAFVESTEEPEVVFDFGEEDKSESASSYSMVYTFIIYK